MKIVSAEFMTGAVSCRQYPEPEWSELAFVGRSNVGKSSLINSLLNRKKLVKTSQTPGKTQEINFFKVNGDFIFADLPGYGFAKVPPAVQKRWKKMIEEYLLNRETLLAVVFIIDMRRNPSPLDLDLKNWLEACDVDYILVGTKADKLSQTELKKQGRKLNDAYFEGEEGELLIYSSKNGRGRKELWSVITALMGK
ncbi:MAG TPA: ribosome biogenesis GTP-binding protein YihA/YsxC [Nitrospinaceae bacterium]|jgi:GTP-binding protein|nr:ribosome biogenesis GTP-binding protein YihA/YsxC [Nitrospinaceae bacterium]HJN99875.1 ribosome biogenesis GTP-binding protein YihA/YsxC [Nitrospinaceae bacterium]|tara:strand:+ start:2779 stop:3366 length:588 start_codon:yes stop_codon:yes gene_type:complete